MMPDCGHGWRDEADCDVCRPPAVVVAGLRDRIAELEAEVRRLTLALDDVVAHDAIEDEYKASVTFRDKLAQAMIGHSLHEVAECLVLALGAVLHEADPSVREKLIEEACARVAKEAMKK